MLSADAPYLSLERRCAPNRAASALMMGTDAIRTLREENRTLEMENALIKLFLDLPPSIAETETDDSRSDAGGRAVVTPHLQTPRARTKRKRPPRKPTTPTPCDYEMDSLSAFEKYCFSVPETARDALYLMMCVPKQDMRDLRRAARMCIMWLLFPSHVEKHIAVHQLRAFLEEHGAIRYFDIMQMSLFKHLNLFLE